MMELTLAAYDAEKIAAEVLRDDVEHCVVVHASLATLSDGSTRLIAREVEIPGPDDYSRQAEDAAELNPAFVAKISKQARLSQQSIVFVHSHPGDLPPRFSRTDDMGEARLAKFLAMRAPGLLHGAMVVSSGGWCGRKLGTSDPMKIVSLGRHRRVLFEPAHADNAVSSLYDRQVRAFGAAGQQALQRLAVAIVGLGGTGSVIAQELAHLGVARFILIDPDRIETTNLNRVVGASVGDVGRPKVDVARDFILGIMPAGRVTCIEADVTRTATARALQDADFIFSCTDSHGSRAVVQQIAYQYLIGCIDVGSVLTADKGKVSGIHGRIQALLPGLPCFTCSGLIDAEEVRRDLMSEAERRADPYIQGAREPAPAVISINGTVSSLAVTMFMAVVLGIPSEGRYVLYNARNPSLRSVSASQNPSCYICSSSGVLARGDSQQLFTRDS